MAILRKLNKIEVTFDSLGNPAVSLQGIVTDDSEGTKTGAERPIAAPAVIADAVALRNSCMLVAANAGKPLTF